MKRRKILILFLLSIFIESYGQEINITNTKDLISISKSKGLISAIGKIDFLPIHYIDRTTTQELLKQTLSQPFSSEIEQFLISLSYYDNLPEIVKPLNNLIRLKTKLCLEEKPIDYCKIEQDEMNLIVNYKNKETELLLIEYYKTWLKLAKNNRTNYILGKSDSLKLKDEPLNVSISNEIYDLMNPYKICNYNCYMTMLTLKKNGK